MTFSPAAHGHIRLIGIAGMLWSLSIVAVPCAASIGALRVASGLSRPVYATSPRGDTERLFIVEQHVGRIRILNLRSGTLNVTPFLTVSGLATGNEQGLLGMAFDPNYAESGLFYVNLTRSFSDTEIRQYRVSAADANVADPSSNRLVMTYDQPFSNHNAGWLDFGPDGYLYISTGDGGSANDPGNRAQDITNQRLGKMLRVDVSVDDFPADDRRNYGIPPDNPFVGLAGDDEIWAFGLRNPWRCCFDRLTGDLYIADVGQNAIEEVHFQPAASLGGENYGWRVMEGNRCNRAADALPCRDPSLVVPIHEYGHGGAPDGGFSITGGYVYRGPIVGLHGTYFFADFVSNQIWSFRYQDGVKTDFTNRSFQLTGIGGSLRSISSFGEDALGNLYICDLGGEVFKLVCTAELAGDFDGDCDVDFADYAQLANAWSTQLGDAAWNAAVDIADPNAGVMDYRDLGLFAEKWLTEVSFVPVPPPPPPGAGRRR